MSSRAFPTPNSERRARNRGFGSLLMAVIVGIVQSGCVTIHPPLSSRFSEHPALGTVAIVAVPVDPAVHLEGFPSGKGSAALGAAGSTFMGCMGNGSMGSCQGAVCGAAALVWLSVCGILTGAGALNALTHAERAQVVEQARAAVGSALELKLVQEGLRAQVAKVASASGVGVIALPSDVVQAAAVTEDYRPLAAQGVDTVLETTLTQIGTGGRGIDPPLNLYMQARVRVVKTSDNSVVLAAAYDYMGERWRLKEWAADDGARVRRALETGYVTLGSFISDQLFLHYPFPYRRRYTEDSIGLAPEFPKTTTSFMTDYLQHDSSWNPVDSLRPTFRWQSFPRERDISAAPAEMARVANVSYELIIAEERGLAPGAIVYFGSGIATNSFRLAEPLKPATKYFWSVRARFEVDGQQRVTEWASSASGEWWQFQQLRPRQLETLKQATAWYVAGPSAAAHRFRTADHASDASREADEVSTADLRPAMRFPSLYNAIK